VLWWTNKCHWLGIGRQLRAGSTHFLWAVAVLGKLRYPPRQSIGGGNQFGGESPPKLNSIVVDHAYDSPFVHHT
jgi:hypothetical protein